MTKPSVLVTGGAGYIGSHVVLALHLAGWPVVVLDNLSTGDRANLPPSVPLIEGDVGDCGLLHELFSSRRIRAVLHLAGSILVSESISNPLLYYQNNTVNSHALIRACVAAGRVAFVFSSTAAAYGLPAVNPVREETPLVPVSPYGWSKVMTEQMLADADAVHDLPHVVLRYFNVGGADPEGRTGAARPSAEHLLTVACEAALGTRGEVPLFGDDYPTADGTCIRDFVHVSDLADAHIKALEYLIAGGASRTFNCGYGRGYSVREVLNAVSRISGRTLSIQHARRRPGDAAEVVAAPERIRRELGWRPRHGDLDRMVRDTLALQRRLSV